jgi:hypothetical protein
LTFCHFVKPLLILSHPQFEPPTHSLVNGCHLSVPIPGNQQPELQLPFSSRGPTPMLAHLESELHSNRIPLRAHQNVGNESNSVCDGTPDRTLELNSMERNGRGGIKAVSKFPPPSPSLLPSSHFLLLIFYFFPCHSYQIDIY